MNNLDGIVPPSPCAMPVFLPSNGRWRDLPAGTKISCSVCGKHVWTTIKKIGIRDPLYLHRQLENADGTSVHFSDPIKCSCSSLSFTWDNQ